MGDLPKLAWSRDVTGKVGNIHSNFIPHKTLIRANLATTFAPRRKVDILIFLLKSFSC